MTAGGVAALSEDVLILPSIVGPGGLTFASPGHCVGVNVVSPVLILLSR